jgi:hypothetical protein
VTSSTIASVVLALAAFLLGALLDDLVHWLEAACV